MEHFHSDHRHETGAMKGNRNGNFAIEPLLAWLLVSGVSEVREVWLHRDSLPKGSAA